MAQSSSGSRMDADLLIVGGGLVGAATAIALGGAGLSVVLIDAEPAADREAMGYDGRASAIAYASRRALESLAVWSRVAPDAEPILDIRVSDARIGEPAPPLFLHYDHRESGLDQPFGHIVENRTIRRALVARLTEIPEVTILAPARIAGLERRPGHVEARLGDG